MKDLRYRDQDRQAAADYVAYARAHPHDSAAQAEARRRTTALAQTTRTDSVIATLVQRGTADTTPRWPFR